MTRTLSYLVWVILAIVHLGQAQVGYNPKTNTLLCSKPGGHYCLEGPLKSPIMMSCLSNTDAEIRSCNIELSKILPGGYEETAVCYESSPSAGDAVCAFNGTGYTFDGSRVKLDETVLCDAPVHLLSKRDGSHQEVHATPTTTITVTVWDRAHTQVEAQISSVDATTSAYSSSWPEHGYTTTVFFGSSSFSSTKFETSPVDSTTPICSNPWPESGHIATAVTVIPGNSSPIPSASSTEPEAEDMDNEETMPTFQPHIFVETSIETESPDVSLYPTIITAIVTEAQTETDSSTMPTDEPPLEDEFEPLIFEHSESESERPWMIVSETQQQHKQSSHLPDLNPSAHGSSLTK
ncbi:hypothetical protein SI65_08000 [Aspergillus cristatus]|uniref:Sushi domain-containing protein n=1 Tax=Aspergillus cristatus TaxID=573508 RepID=A0A1E3B6B0_ASPCR|nr:hypothetical protein SI65_08000 [Aspergillus cristatus]